MGGQKDESPREAARACVPAVWCCTVSVPFSVCSLRRVFAAPGCVTGTGSSRVWVHRGGRQGAPGAMV